ncbi:MAG: glycosyl hydrolase family 28 protein [bacterium]|nr:glycosyl hydrolase family 28 protein [bacterium]
MKRNCMTVLVTLVLMLAAVLPAIAEDNPTLLTIYEGPKTMTSSQIATASVNGNDLFVYDVMVNHEHIWNANTQPARTPMTYFDFEGKVRVEITMPGLEKPVESAKVIPQSYGIEPTVKDGVVSFIITEPGQYTVVLNDSVNKAMHIFANPLETDVPDPNDPNVFYIGPGEWVMDAIALKDNQTLYISGGAVVHSIVSVANAENVRICGRGIIDGSDYPAWNQPGSTARVPIDLNHSKNVMVEGVILANSNCWNLNSYSSKDVTIDNVKIISGRQNGDGFTFQSCTNHLVTNCFARTWDDSLVLKNYSGSTKGITFRNIQIWTDLAQSMEIGYETDKGWTLDPEISDVLFEDITVLYNFHKPVISIHNSDDAYVHDIVYRNIVVENALMQGDNGNNKELIEMTLLKSGWSTVKDEYGAIDNVLIDGLTVLNTLNGKMPASRFVGHNEKHRITNVTLRNVTINGEPITDLKTMKVSVNDYCEAITIE